MLKRSNCDPCYWRLLPKVIHKRLLIENLMISMTLFLFIIRHPLLASLVARGQDNMFLLLDCILHKRKIVYTEFFTKRYSFLSVIPTETWPQHNLHTGSRPLSLIWQFVKHFHVRPFEKVKVNVLLGLWSGIKKHTTTPHSSLTCFFLLFPANVRVYKATESYLTYSWSPLSKEMISDPHKVSNIWQEPVRPQLPRSHTWFCFTSVPSKLHRLYYIY